MPRSTIDAMSRPMPGPDPDEGPVEPHPPRPHEPIPPPDQPGTPGPAIPDPQPPRYA